MEFLDLLRIPIQIQVKFQLPLLYIKNFFFLQKRNKLSS